MIIHVSGPAILGERQNSGTDCEALCCLPASGAARQEAFPNYVKVASSLVRRYLQKILSAWQPQFTDLTSCHETASIIEHKAFVKIKPVRGMQVHPTNQN